MRVRVSPSRRKSKAESPELPEVKLQLNGVPALEFAAMAVPAAGLLRASMFNSAWLLLAERLLGRMLLEVVKLPEIATEVTAAETVSVVSRSVTVSEPLVLRVALVSVNEPTSPAEVSLAEISGVSLVPVMVTVTVLLPLKAGEASSVAVMV